MRLRVKLFVYVGVLFVSVGLVSFFVQRALIDATARNRSEALRAQIDRLNAETTKRLNVYIDEILFDYQMKVNALLSVIKEYPAVRLGFSGEYPSLHQSSWLDSSTLITNNKWLDIVQNVKNGNLASSILIDQDVLPLTELHDVAQDLKMTTILDEEGKQRLTVAIPWNIGNIIPSKEPIYKIQGSNVADFYILFEPKSIMAMDLDKIESRVFNLSINPLYPFLKWVEINGPNPLLNSFVSQLKKAKAALAANPSLEIDFNYQHIAEATPASEQDKELAHLINRYEQIGMLWGYTSLIAAGPFGDSPFNALAPIGVVRTPKDKNIGSLLLRHNIFVSHSFEVGSDHNANQEELENILKVILFNRREGRCCFGNTLYFGQNGGPSTLTLGMDAEEIFRRFALATERTIIFVSDNRVISMVNASGKMENEIELTPDQITTLLANTQGTIEIDGADFFYLHIHPASHQGFHFFLLKPVSEAFRLVNENNEGLAWIEKRVTLQMAVTGIGILIVLLFFLDRIARNISKPIVELVHATNVVREGHLEESAFQEPSEEVKKKEAPSYKNEVDTLYDSFYAMIRGLQEKEKVRSILNKVVSPEIASEILKTNVNLGGEEREVVILFSDVRNFTGLSEKMKPTEVIEMINTCMTKACAAIDKNHGVVDKFVGDEVMALFGAILPSPDAAKNAIQCAMEIVQLLDEWNLERESRGEPRIDMGIGINKGKVCVGNMGAANHLNYTVIGFNVNLAARLCSHASAREILVAKSLTEELQVQETFSFEEKKAQLKGITGETVVYKVLGYKKNS